MMLWTLWQPRPETPAPKHLDVKLGPGIKLSVDAVMGPAAVLSTDESMLAFAGEPEAGGERRLYIRPLDELEAKPVPGTESAHHPVSFINKADTRVYDLGTKTRIAFDNGRAQQARKI
jgi:hypothetical protein